MDQRPTWMQLASEYRLNPDNDAEHKRARRDEGLHSYRIHTFPLWWATDAIPRRRTRLLNPTMIPTNVVTRIVTELGISNPKRFDFEFSISAMLGNLLETWGQGHLTPAYDPPKAQRRTLKAYRRHSTREIVW